MKTKIKILKTNIDRYLPILEKKYPMAKLISSAIAGFIHTKVDDRGIHTWYRSLDSFIEEIEKEIVKFEDSDFLMDEIISFKDKMDIHYSTLENRYGTLFLQVYSSITLILEEGKLDEDLKEFYINIYSSLEIIEDEITKIKSDR